MKHIQLDISKKLYPQFIAQFEMKPQGVEYVIHPRFSDGAMEFIEFPSKLDFYHFKSAVFRTPVLMRSMNPLDTERYVFHINLSHVKQLKKVDGNIIEFQKHLPMGILVYGPGIDIETFFEANANAEVVTFHIHQEFLRFYFGKSVSIDSHLLYEDLDYAMEERLRLALNHMHTKIACHQYVLEFVELLVAKLKKRRGEREQKKMHMDDVKSLFMASSRLRNPVQTSLPSLDELAAVAKMSKSKFKMLFKQLFGVSPMQFHHKIRMQYAKDELVTRRKNPTQLSFELGYSHPSNFTTAFKKYFGELPSTFN